MSQTASGGGSLRRELTQEGAPAEARPRGEAGAPPASEAVGPEKPASPAPDGQAPPTRSTPGSCSWHQVAAQWGSISENTTTRAGIGALTPRAPCQVPAQPGDGPRPAIGAAGSTATLTCAGPARRRTRSGTPR